MCHGFCTIVWVFLDAKRQTRDQAMNNQTMTLAMMDVLGETAAAEDLRKCKTLLSTEEAIPLLVLNSIVATFKIFYFEYGFISLGG